MSASRASAGVIAAGVAAIVGSCLALLGGVFMMLGLAFLPSTPAAHELPRGVQTLAMMMVLFFLGLGVLGVFTGVGVIRLKNWARLSAMIWAGISASFSALILFLTVLLPFPTPPTQDAVPVGFLKGFLFVFYAIPLAVGIWWLWLFNRASVRAQFLTTGPPSSQMIADAPVGPASEMLAKPRCPLPVAVIAGFLAFSFAFAFLMPFLHLPIPVVIFGHRFHGQPGAVIFAISATLMLAGAIGLWKLQRWSYPLIVGLQLFWLLSGTITFLSPSYERNMQEVRNEFQIVMPSGDVASQIYQHERVWAAIGLLPTMIILVILLYYRLPFAKAAEEAKNSASE